MQAKPEYRLDHDAGRTERSEFRHCPGTLSIKRRSRFTAPTKRHCNPKAKDLLQTAHRPPHRGSRDAQRRSERSAVGLTEISSVGRSEISSVGLRIRLLAVETWATFLLRTFCPLRSLGFSNTPMDQKGTSVLIETNFLVLRHSRECRVSHKVHLGVSFASVSGASRRSGSPTCEWINNRRPTNGKGTRFHHRVPLSGMSA